MPMYHPAPHIRKADEQKDFNGGVICAQLGLKSPISNFGTGHELGGFKLGQDMTKHLSDKHLNTHNSFPFK